ncbi:MAG: antitoxin [Wenzhouxiangella sp.]
MSRLTIDVTEQQHQTLKALAALEGKTLRQYALERLFPAEGDGQQAHERLKALLAERLAEARRGGVVQGSIGELAEKALAAESGE